MKVAPIIIITLLCQTASIASAGDDLEGIDVARAFPIQKNSTAIHHSSKKQTEASPNQDASSTSTESNKPPPNDTSLSINGNGGSSNRPAGGSATLRKHFSFD
ncbi:hypothetical protein [Polynucleobacter sp. MWH-Braz-FAM2G]|uniref:hypothetical protein n=1 Tax=Polynucleobacter sp. MWH-Braz-FAM2G TaxID=1855883 RepID=UPI001BFEA127|nr:hypothetical protein [Polynucleobacter sp. MWH-Braz-FAM2G]QWD90194.1 hypothetical protein FD973_07820 [Polynucleobacter sp. MWH-Braz-FAM2G]